MKKKVIMFAATFIMIMAVIMPATVFAAQSDFYGNWEGAENYYNAPDDWLDYSVTITETEVSFMMEGEEDGGGYFKDVFVCDGLVWDAEYSPGGWGGDLGIGASGIVIDVEGYYIAIGMSVGGDCAVNLDLSNENNTLTAQFGDGFAFSGGYRFSRVIDDGETEEELEDEENPKTSDINIGFISLTSIIALAGITIAGVTYKKSSVKR